MKTYTAAALYATQPPPVLIMAEALTESTILDKLPAASTTEMETSKNKETTEPVDERIAEGASATTDDPAVTDPTATGTT